MRTLLSFCCLLVAVAVHNVTSYAQELDANVVVNMQAIPIDQRQELQTMANDVKNYLNNQRYTGADWDGARIPVDVTIYLMSRNGNTYTGRLAVVSKRLVNNVPGSGAALLRIFDQEWTFEWSFNPVLTYQTLRYDDFTSLIDFYMLLAIGLDMDTYEDLGGTSVYKSAQTIAQLGAGRGINAFRTFYQPGEFTRSALVNEMLDLRYNGLRRYIFDYHDAIDQYAKNKDAGRAALTQVIADIAQFKRDKISNRSLLLQAFFDAKHMEIADIFQGQKNSTVWGDLRFLDPGNTTVYDKARGN